MSDAEIMAEDADTMADERVTLEIHVYECGCSVLELIVEAEGRSWLSDELDLLVC